MLNNNRHNSTCAFAGQIVSYIYGEASESEKIDFAAHLDKCSGCSDEFKAFGFVRSSIQEWRSEEIFALEIPALEIPNLQTVHNSAKQTNSVETNSWLAGLRRLFSHSPKLAFGSAAFAALLLCAGLVFAIFNFSNNNEIVSESNIDSKTELAANVNNIKEETFPNPIPAQPKSASETTGDKVEQSQFDSRKNSTLKAGDNSNREQKNKIAVQKQNQTVATTGIENKKNKTNNTTKQEVPKLYKSEETEDETLRLSDLFAEIGTR